MILTGLLRGEYSWMPFAICLCSVRSLLLVPRADLLPRKKRSSIPRSSFRYTISRQRQLRVLAMPIDVLLPCRKGACSEFAQTVEPPPWQAYVACSPHLVQAPAQHSRSRNSRTGGQGWSRGSAAEPSAPDAGEAGGAGEKVLAA